MIYTSKNIGGRVGSVGVGERWWRRRWQGRGFALVASLTLMMLLGLIAVGVLSIASTQNRLAAHAALQAEARQQALIGLDAAMNEMQMALGPDQRVTASSGILAEGEKEPQHILGVWDSWKHALYDKSAGGIQDTYTAGREAHFRRWLVSSRNPQELSEMKSVKTLGTSKPGVRVCLVGEGTLGRSAEQYEYVYADLVEMPSGGRNTASYAWWVSGENQKVNVVVKKLEPAVKEVEVLSRTWDTPAPSFAESPTLSFLEDLKEEEKYKVLTQDGLAMACGEENDKLACFYNVTTYSYSLPTNVRDGGLKHDLNLLLNKKDLQHTPYAPLSNRDCPLADDRAIPEGTEKMPIGSWQTLHAYHNTWPSQAAGSDDGAFSARLCGNVNKAYSRMSGYLKEGAISNPSEKDEVTFYDTRAVANDKKAGYARTPVMLAFVGAHGLARGFPQNGGSGHSYGLSYAPYVQWWNPYNVPMHVGAKKLWTYSLPYRTTSILVWVQSKWTRYVSYQPFNSQGNGSDAWLSGVDGTASGQRNTFANDWGNYFVNSKSDETGDIVFAPGEILVFSMSETFNNLDYQNQSDASLQLERTRSFSQPQKVPFYLGDNAGELNNYFISLFSFGAHEGDLLALSYETAAAYDQAVQNRWISTRIDDDGSGTQLDGQNTNQRFIFDSIGDFVGPKVRNMFTVIHGFDGVDASDKANLDLTQSRRTSRVDRFYGAHGVSPQYFGLAWYDYDTTDVDEMKFCGEKEGYTWTDNMSVFKPLYFAATGIVPKSYNPSLNALLPIFRQKDYRTKVWQHSNPAFGSSPLYKPDDQERQYHPFQLAGIEMGSGLGRGSLDTLNNRNGVYGTMSAGAGGGESVSFLSVLELPYHPPFSLAGFSGMRLSPGWYEQEGSQDSIAKMRRLQYRAGVPGVGIGNSFADPCLPAQDVYSFHESSHLKDLEVRAHKNIFSEFYDHAFLINDALWDRWFCSSLADRPESDGGERKVDMTLRNFMKENEPLPISRYKKNTNGEDAEQVIRRIMEDDGWMRIARYLLIEGGFNINSVSEEAWTATLLGLSRRDLLSNAEGTLRKIQKRNSHEVLFSRFMVSTANRPIDSYSYDPLQGSSALRPSLKMATAWGEVRALSPEEIRELARQIIKQVRARGPFLNMADFINRRLDGGSDNALTGALQAAIDATDINKAFIDDEYKVKVQKEGKLYKYQKAAEGSMYTAAPGYLIQSDVLTALGNILTVRDDSFVVRAYGCVRNARNAVLAQAWCEATVQRTIQYVDAAANTPEDCDRTDAAGRSKSMRPLSEINRIMGRKLKIISFRWLDSWDI